MGILVIERNPEIIGCCSDRVQLQLGSGGDASASHKVVRRNKQFASHIPAMAYKLYEKNSGQGRDVRFGEPIPAAATCQHTGCILALLKLIVRRTSIKESCLTIRQVIAIDSRRIPQYPV